MRPFSLLLWFVSAVLLLILGYDIYSQGLSNLNMLVVVAAFVMAILVYFRPQVSLWHPLVLLIFAVATAIHGQLITGLEATGIASASNLCLYIVFISLAFFSYEFSK